ncbi:MAG: chemotaxis response regulator protein-glutamate methylesterase [Gammaproteobacteria bacterium]
MRGHIIRVLVVDDSAFFRRVITRALTADPMLEVIGEAADGREAVAMAARLSADVITMDVDMPILDGIAAVRAIMAARPCPVLMISALTRAGAEATLAALDAGACDFLAKHAEGDSAALAGFTRELVARVKSVARQRPGRRASAAAARRVAPALDRAPRTYPGLECVVIGASTGGPPVIGGILGALPAAFPLPLVVAQHMPGTFTSCFAERLDQQSAVRVCLAADGAPVVGGTAYICPGGMQTTLARDADGAARLCVTAGDPAARYRPSIDVTFGAAARVFGAHVLGIVLTGMGDDGCAGGRALKAGGAPVWAQDEASSVVFGMPRAVIEAGLADSVLPSVAIAPRLLEAL